MSISLATKYDKRVDELFKAESKLSLLTNSDYDWSGAKTVRIYKMSTAELNDYSRNISDAQDITSLSRYGDLLDLSATTEEHVLSQDKSFIFNVDAMDEDETNEALTAETALARELREVVVPYCDTYVYAAICDGADSDNVVDDIDETERLYPRIFDATEAFDDNEVPETDRVLIMTPKSYRTLKTENVFDFTPIPPELTAKGVVAEIDGMRVIKVPSARLPENFAFAVVHPSAVTAPFKLQDYHVHTDTPLSSGSVVTGRIYFDAFVLENKVNGIYVAYYAADAEPAGNG